MIAFASSQIKKRKKRFGLFIRTKRYTNIGEKYENYLKENGYEYVQNQILLTNSSLRAIKEPIKNGKYTVLADFLPSNPLSTQPTQCNKM